jgi:hypothetical protein
MAQMFRIYSVIQRPNADDYWLKVGAAFPHEDGQGYNLFAGVAFARKREASDAGLRRGSASRAGRGAGKEGGLGAP